LPTSPVSPAASAAARSRRARRGRNAERGGFRSADRNRPAGIASPASAGPPDSCENAFSVDGPRARSAVRTAVRETRTRLRVCRRETQIVLDVLSRAPAIPPCATALVGVVNEGVPAGRPRRTSDPVGPVATVREAFADENANLFAAGRFEFRVREPDDGVNWSCTAAITKRSAIWRSRHAWFVECAVGA